MTFTMKRTCIYDAPEAEYYDQGDRKKGFALYKKAAEMGYAKAQHIVAECYRFGLGTKKDGTEAVRWYQKAADQDYLPSIYALGECYMWGSYGLEKALRKLYNCGIKRPKRETQ